MITSRTPSGDWIIQGEEENFDVEEFILVYLLSWMMTDCSLCKEYCSGVDVYDHCTGKTVRIPYSDLDKLKAGETVVFHARETEFNDGDKVMHYLYDLPATIICVEEGTYVLQFDDDGMIIKANRDEITPYFD